MKLRTKLTFAFLVVGLVPLALASHSIFLSAEKAIDEEVEVRLLSLASGQKHRAASYVRQNEERFDLVASRTQLRLSAAEFLRSGDAAEARRIERILVDAVEGVEPLVAASILDASGRTVLSTDADRVGSEGGEPFLRTGPAGRSTPAFAVEDGALSLRIGGPLRLEGAVGGLVLEVDPEEFMNSLLLVEGLGRTGETILAARSPSGEAIYLTPAARRTLGSGASEEAVAAALGGERAVVRRGVDEDGRSVLAALEHLDPPGWAVVVQFDEEEAFARLARTRQLVLFIVLFACALTAGVSLFVARKITRPIVRLTRAARRIGSGDLSPVAVGRTSDSDELGILVAAFNDMASRLRGTYQAMEAEVDERKRAEGEARHLAAIVESSADAIYGMDLEGRVTSWNAAAEQLFGWTAPEMMGQSIDRNAPSARAEEPQRIREAISRGARIDDFETVRLSKSGHSTEVSLTVSPIRDQDGRIVGSSTIARDITRRREAERDLAYAEARLAHIIDAMPSIVVAVDPKGRVTHWNSKATLETGRPAAETLATPIAEALPAFAPHVGLFQLAVEEGKPQQSEKIRTGVGLQARFWDLTAYPLVAGSVLGAVVRIDDVTERVHLEERMIQSEKMMSVGSLAAGMAHEINNPLGAILQGVQNIQRRLSPGLDKNREAAASAGIDLDRLNGYLEARRVLRFLEGIRDAGRRAAKIVGDMLAFSRRGGTRLIPVDLGECLDTSVRLAATDYDLKKRYDFKHIEIVRQYDPAVGRVTCDPAKLEQVFLNLLKNAAQAMSGNRNGGRPARIVLSTAREGNSVRIEVSDNGSGMDEEVRRRVFEPFFTTKEVGEGTGLGLSVSYFIVNQHGGTMTVESHKGEGTRFIIRLPLAQGE